MRHSAAFLTLAVCTVTAAGAWGVALATRGTLARRLRAEIDEEAAAVIARLPPKTPGSRGVVMCAGGRYLGEAYASLRQLRAVGCTLPIEVMHVGPAEVPEAARRLFRADIGDVRFVDVVAADLGVSPTSLQGFEIKPYATLLTSFEKTLFLDADSSPLKDPTPLLDAYDHLFWPDFGVSNSLVRPDWACGVFAPQPPPGPETESGQFIVDTSRCARGLVYAWLLNKHQGIFYKHYYGDKDLFRLGFLMAGVPFRQVEPLPGIVGNDFGDGPLLCAIVQHAPDGAPLFVHRNMHKRLRRMGIKPAWDTYVSNADEDGSRACIRWLRDFIGTALPGKPGVPGWPELERRLTAWESYSVRASGV